jgi:hypothetical protein
VVFPNGVDAHTELVGSEDSQAKLSYIRFTSSPKNLSSCQSVTAICKCLSDARLKSEEHGVVLGLGSNEANSPKQARRRVD